MKNLKFTITIKGTVQGVGFRPFVYRTAKEHAVCGDVCNNNSGVTIHAFGHKAQLDNFVMALKRSFPPLAIVKSFQAIESFVQNCPSDFIIVSSDNDGLAEIDISRDTAVCNACQKELFDPLNHRYLHPFINCTDCGPRYTIIKSMPYDRIATTMASFPICEVCNREYLDPANRRFHAQPICCPNCGPTLFLADSLGNPIATDNPIIAAIDLLEKGKILAIKGLGGFHLACRADRSDTVLMLRQKKKRDEKPFALMVKDTNAARPFVTISDQEQLLLESPERPIVILDKRINIPGIVHEVAPGLTTLGIMLPYTPIHHLLFDAVNFSALVMTSANMSDQPIVFDNAQAYGELGSIADAFLTHDRGIYMRNDDSIVRSVGNNAVILRRSRGYVPEALPSPYNVDGLVSLGGVLKSTIGVGRKSSCYLSHYIGAVSTLDDIDNMDFARKHLTGVLSVSPTKYICDLHPQSLVTAYAERQGLPVVKIQHHHAHAAACMADNELTGDAICIVYDGTGYGDDGTTWGGEILHASYTSYKRFGHLSYLKIPGGDEAIRYPGRIAFANLIQGMGNEAFMALPWMPQEEKQGIFDMVNANVNCAVASSMGRLFDAVSALLGVCKKRTYEGQPAIMLEGIADTNEKGSYGAFVDNHDSMVKINGSEILNAVFIDGNRGESIQKISAKFHNTIAESTVKAAVYASGMCNCKTVCLSGGVFQNVFLLKRVLLLLQEAGLTAFTHKRTPPNDESISYGQLVIGGALKNYKQTA